MAMKPKPAVPKDATALLPGRRYAYDEGQLYTTFHDRPEQTLAVRENQESGADADQADKDLGFLAMAGNAHGGLVTALRDTVRAFVPSRDRCTPEQWAIFEAARISLGSDAQQNRSAVDVTAVLNTEVIAALRGLMNYVGGWDEKPGHPCAIARDALAKVDLVRPKIAASVVLRELVETHGLTSGECMQLFTEQRGEWELAAVAAAQSYGVEGKLEFDANAMVSCTESGEGCYVAGWQWIPADEIREHLESSGADASTKQDLGL